MGKPLRDSKGQYAGYLGDGVRPPLSGPIMPGQAHTGGPVPPGVPLPGAAVWDAFQTVTAETGPVPEPADADTGSGVTATDVAERSWMREQAERFGMDPDVTVGPELFTDEEWAAMRADPVAFGLQLLCGCRPGSCPSEYGGDCYTIIEEQEAGMSAWHSAITDDPDAVTHLDPLGVEWRVRPVPGVPGRMEYAAVGFLYDAYDTSGTLEETLTLIDDGDVRFPTGPIPTTPAEDEYVGMYPLQAPDPPF